MTHKSSPNRFNYERLEFLGDTILNYIICKKLYKEEDQGTPKELHKLKSAITNNVILSLVVIEYELHDLIIFNESSEIQNNMDSYVNHVQMLKDEAGEDGVLDLDSLHENHVKIFADIFESLVGAIFIDLLDMDKTEDIVLTLLQDKIEKYGT